MADIPMSRMDDEGIEQQDELTAAITAAKRQMASAAKSLKKLRNKGLGGKANKVLDLAEELLGKIDKSVGNPFAVATLVEDFENQTAEVQAELHQALEGGDVTVSSLTTLLAQISDIGNIARGL